MKDRDDHNYRSGISLRITPKPHLGFGKLDERMEILRRFTEGLGTDLDYDLDLMTSHDGPNVCLTAEHERTRKPGRVRDASYLCFRDNVQACSYLAGKLILVRHVAEALELDVRSHGFYHEEL